MASLERIRRMIAIAVRLGYLLLLMFLLIVPAKLQASNNDLHLKKDLKITGCPPPPPNYYPYTSNTYCNSAPFNAGVYGCYTKLLTLDSILLGFKYNFTPGCPAPPPSYYPYTAPPYCQNAITDAGIYGEWWLLASIDSALGGGGGGFISGTLTPDHIPYASAPHTLSDGPLVVSGSNIDIPAFLFGPTGYYFTLNGAAAMGYGNCQVTLNPTAGSAFLGATLNNYVSFSKTNGLFVPDSIAEEFSTDSFDIKIPTATAGNVGNVLTLVNSKGGAKWAAQVAGLTGYGSIQAIPMFKTNTDITNSILSQDSANHVIYLPSGGFYSNVYLNGSGIGTSGQGLSMGAGYETVLRGSNSTNFVEVAQDAGIGTDVENDQLTKIGVLDDIMYSIHLNGTIGVHADPYVEQTANHPTARGRMFCDSLWSPAIGGRPNHNVFSIHDTVADDGTEGELNGLIVGGDPGQSTAPLQVMHMPYYTNNTAAKTAGLTAGAFYLSVLLSGDTVVKVVH